MNSLTAIGCDMTISNHTRFSENCKPSILDQMYTNLTKKVTCSGVALCKLSDHQSTFLRQRTQNVI